MFTRQAPTITRKSEPITVDSDEYYATVPLSVILGVDDSCLRLYAYLAAKIAPSRQGGYALSKEMIAEDLGWSLSKVYRCTERLVNLGVLTVRAERLRGNTFGWNRYTVLRRSPMTDGHRRSPMTDGRRSLVTDGPSVTGDRTPNTKRTKTNNQDNPPTPQGGKSERGAEKKTAGRVHQCDHCKVVGADVVRVHGSVSGDRSEKVRTTFYMHPVCATPKNLDKAQHPKAHAIERLTTREDWTR